MGKEAVILLRGKDKAVRNRHHWIFSGAVKSYPSGFENGGIYPVESEEGGHLGFAYFNKKCSIAGRMLSFGTASAEEEVRRRIEAALALRGRFFDEQTNAFRLINAEGDGLPGLVVDRYADVLVVQIATLGMDRLKPLVVEELTKKLRPRSIFEKSSLPVRREEGLEDSEAFLYGERTDRVEILEGGFRFLVDIVHSQKTGFFLDQREMRKLVRSFSKGRTVLNAFSYTGAFTVYALSGGAVRVDSVDTSERSLDAAWANLGLNGFDPEANGFFSADVFEYLRLMETAYGFIILDPPAFAKRKQDVVQACRGYKDINRLAFQKILPGGLVLTFSCSHHVDETLFRQVVFQAAREAGRDVRVLQRHRMSYDHPLNIYHPESEYLKGFLLFVE